MISDEFYRLVKALAEHPSFSVVLAASDDQVERQRHMEYTSRFLVDTFIPYDGKLDVEDYIDTGIISLASSSDFTKLAKCFRQTFDLLSEAHGDKALRRLEKGKHQGRVGLAAFECIAVGIGKNIDAIKKIKDPVKFVRDRIQLFWTSDDLARFQAPGLRGTIRIQRTIPFGQQMFRP